jgi:hypothetical protein
MANPRKTPRGYAVAPTEIFLQLHGECSDDDLDKPVDYQGSDDVTWCWHRIHNTDVRYVRADLSGVPARVTAADPQRNEGASDERQA